MKEFSKAQVDDIVKLRWGKLISNPKQTAFASYKTIGKIFGVSGSKIYQLCQQRFKEVKAKALPLLERLRLPEKHEGRKNWGYRFLK